MTNQEFIEHATDKWMGLLEKKSRLSKQDLDTMKTLITYIIESTLQFKEQQLIEKACEYLKDNTDMYFGFIDDFKNAMKGEYNYDKT